jgi:hypothetical protein
MTEMSEPRWSQNPGPSEIGRRALEELELELERAGPPGSDVRDPVVAEIFSGACWRELGAARDDLNRAKGRYHDAVLGARDAGLSWGEIARVIGTTRQQLHRRFG